MAGSLNKVILVGHLGQDPKISYTQSGQPVANLRMATSERFKDKSGQWTDRTEWHTVVAWGKDAEFCSNYLGKGALVMIEGRLQTRKWQDKEGQDRYTTEIRAEQMQMLGSRQGSGGGGGGESYGGGGGGYGGGDDFDQAPRQSAPRQAPSRPAPAPQSAPPSSSGGFGGMDDDIPF